MGCGASHIAGNQPLKVIIAGAPASGKGTQCELIVQKFGLVHISTGDMLRAAGKAGTELGKKAAALMEAGQLVPDDLIIGIVMDRLAEEDCKTRGWLLDGFPRTQGQAQALVDKGIVPDAFLYLNVPDELLVERVVGRRTDPDTGKIYHLKFNPPPEDAALKARLQQRADDTEETCKKRLQQFHSNITAVRGTYEKQLMEVDGAKAKNDVFALVLAKLQGQ